METSVSLVVLLMCYVRSVASTEKNDPASLQNKNGVASFQNKNIPASLQNKNVPASLQNKNSVASFQNKNIPASLQNKNVPASLQNKTCIRHISIEASMRGNHSIEERCPNMVICNRTFKLAFMRRLSGYYSTGSSPIEIMLEQCCGGCNKQIDNKIRYIDVSDIPHPSENSVPDFIFPVFGREKATRMYGYHFLPYGDAPGAIYVSRKHTTTSLSSVIGIYPLIIIMFLMSMIAGFIVWLLETWENKEEFSRPFVSGWFDGFWWSFVTMTTVGYGDKSPKSVAGRLFTMIWIVMGLVVCGMITGWLIEEIFQAGTQPPPCMKGKRVGMIRDHDYEGYIVAKYGGIAVEVEGYDMDSAFFTLIRMLRTNKEDDGENNKDDGDNRVDNGDDRVDNGDDRVDNGDNRVDNEDNRVDNGDNRVYDGDDRADNGDNTEYIDGFLFDRFNLWDLHYRLNLWRATKYKNRTADIEYFFNETVRTEKFISEPKLAYGILVKPEHYEYFGDYVRDNRFNRESLLERSWIKEQNHMNIVEELSNISYFKPGDFHTLKDEIMSASGAYFRYSLITLSVALLFICLFGVVYEVRRRRGLFGIQMTLGETVRMILGEQINQKYSV